MATLTPLDDVLELAALLRPMWASIDAELRASGVPLNEGDPDPDPHPGKGDPDPDPGKGDPDPAKGDPDPDPDPDWKAESRKHERRAKQERKAREELERKLKERDDADKSEQEKAIEKAREEAKTEALTESQKERRNDRLEVAVARNAAKTFADVDDALVHIKRAIDNGDVDEDDIFDSEGKVQTEALKTALDDLLERKPHLKATPGRAAGSADAGRGSGSGKSADDMSIDDHLKAVQSR
jgi:hypothetical protein